LPQIAYNSNIFKKMKFGEGGLPIKMDIAFQLEKNTFFILDFREHFIKNLSKTVDNCYLLAFTDFFKNLL